MMTKVRRQLLAKAIKHPLWAIQGVAPAVWKAVRHPLWATRIVGHWLDMELGLSKYAKASNKGERLIIKDWESERNGSDFTSLAHIQRYEWLLPLVKKAKVLLDDGCGSGYGAHYLARHGVEQVVGIDVSKDAIRYAQKHYSAENIKFVNMNACSMGFMPGTFYAIVTFDVFEHIPYELKDKFVSETARVLKPDGSLYIGCPNGPLAAWDCPFHYELSVKEIREILARYYKNIRILGQDISINGVRQGKHWHDHLDDLTMKNLAIVEQDCESAFGLLAICKQPVKSIDWRARPNA